jgi:hypothetical protein
MVTDRNRARAREIATDHHYRAILHPNGDGIAFDPFRRPNQYAQARIDHYAEERVRRHLNKRLQEFKAQVQRFLERSANTIPQCVVN